jgi:hypothetical protein
MSLWTGIVVVIPSLVSMMSLNRIRFQPGMIVSALHKTDGTEAQCEAALTWVRWPLGLYVSIAARCAPSRFDCMDSRAGSCHDQAAIREPKEFDGSICYVDWLYCPLLPLSPEKTPPTKPFADARPDVLRARPNANRASLFPEVTLTRVRAKLIHLRRRYSRPNERRQYGRTTARMCAGDGLGRRCPFA